MVGTKKQKRPWIRGVNLGGWLVLERFITPYFFALTSCHLQGDFRFFPNQIDAPAVDSPQYKLIDDDDCTPVQPYPVDEYTLTGAFQDKAIAKQYMEIHWDNFVKRQDISNLKSAGVTHIRVPLGHWIMGDIIRPEEPWVDGGWLYFVRLVSWCREEGIQVWPDLHTAPGSQNGFDNSGQLLTKDGPTCVHWKNSTANNVQRTLQAVTDIVTAIVRDGLKDVVTGFGILNEPLKDCNETLIRDYNRKAFTVVRDNLGESAAVYIGDMFNSSWWDDGWRSNPPSKYNNTFLDSHYYHVFDERTRSLSPRQHIALVCHKNFRDTTGCCYEDYPENTIPSQGISRLIGEWSASFDTLVVDMLDLVMKGIAANGKAPFFDRQIEPKRQDFLRRYVEAQMVTYEASTSSGWFYWTFKTEGGAFAEWDFLRGIAEDWIPAIPSPDVASVDLYGTCESIIFRTDDDTSIVHEFPDKKSLDPNNWQGFDITDDVVISHGDSLLDNKSDTGLEKDSSAPEVGRASINGTNPKIKDENGVGNDTGGAAGSTTPSEELPSSSHRAVVFVIALLFGGLIVLGYFRDERREGYTELQTFSSMDV